MSEPPAEFYTEERWQNWVDRVRETDIDPEDEDSGRLLLNMQEDTAIAVAKVLKALESDAIDDDRTLDELQDVQEVVLGEVDIEDEDTLMLIDSVQTSLACVLESAIRYVSHGPAEDAPVEEYVHAAADAEAEEDLDAAFGYTAEAGTLLVDGEELDISISEDLEYGYVSEWVDGLVSLQSAMRDPEVVEEDDEE